MLVDQYCDESLPRNQVSPREHSCRSARDVCFYNPHILQPRNYGLPRAYSRSLSLQSFFSDMSSCNLLHQNSPSEKDSLSEFLPRIAQCPENPGKKSQHQEKQNLVGVRVLCCNLAAKAARSFCPDHLAVGDPACSRAVLQGGLV